MKKLPLLFILIQTTAWLHAQTPGQNVIDRKNTGPGFTRESVTIANGQLLGRTSSGTLSGLTLGSGLTLTGTTIAAAGASSSAWADITGKPATFPPASHDHELSGVTGLQDLLDSKAPIQGPNFLGAISVNDVPLGTAAMADFGTDEFQLLRWASNSNNFPPYSIVTATELGALKRTSVLPVSLGGTGAATAQAALNNLLPSQTDNAARYLASDGTNSSWQVINYNASDITGNFQLANFDEGINASASTYWRGDRTWAALPDSITSITGTANQITVTGTTTPTLSLPATITGLTSVTSTTFVGALTGLASGNLPLTGGTLTGALSNSRNGAASASAFAMTGTVFTGGSSTTTKPLALIEPAGSASNSWSTSGTMLGINSAAGYTGDLLAVKVDGTSLVSNDGTSIFKISGNGNMHLGSGFWKSAGFGGIEYRHNLFIFGGFGINLNGTGVGAPIINFNSTSAFSTPSAGLLDLRYGTTSQAFRVYNTWTSLTDNESAVLDWKTTTNTLRIGSDKGSGGGSNRAVHFIMGGAVEMRLDTDGNVILPLLPTSAPATSGALWRDAAADNVLKVVP